MFQIKKFALDLIPQEWELPARYWYRAIRGMHEFELSVLSEYVNPRKRSIDVGANIGIYSYALSRLGSTVESFEPLTECALVILAFGHSRIHVHSEALSDVEGEMTIHFPIVAGYPNTPLASLEHKQENGGRRNIQVRTLDSFNFIDIGFIKIDVEGHEMHVIEGARETIRKCRPVLLVEIEQRHHGTEPIEDVMNRICALGYKGNFYSDGRVRPLSEFSVSRHQKWEDFSSGRYLNNFFFTPI